MFLDMEVFFCNCKFQTTLFAKRNDRIIYLHFDSAPFTESGRAYVSLSASIS